uniref:Uncharacterized protein n=1 Tax=Ciona savignyi TaxID=51511 RepID=H2Y6Q8_CIOSA
MSVDTRQDHVDFPIRSVRIGSLKTFPVQVDDGMDSKKTTIPLHLDESGVKFTVLPEGEVDRDKQITIKISSKRIERVEVYVLRGCPVIYIITDEKMAKSIRRTCNMNDRMSYFYDPKSNVLAEQHITVITDQDPLPFALAHNIQKIFKQIFKNHGKRMDTSFKVLSQRECNDKLVQCTLSNEEIQTKKRLAARNVDKVVEESGSEMSDMSTEEAVPEEVTVTKKKKDKSYKTVARPKDDKQPTVNRPEAFSPSEKSKVDISPNSAR